MEAFTQFTRLLLFFLHILFSNKRKDFLFAQTHTFHNKEETYMSSRSSNKAAVPEAKSALDRFKYEVAGELGVPLKDGYNGDLTSKQNGSVGGYMVKKMIEAQERQMAGK